MVVKVSKGKLSPEETRLTKVFRALGEPNRLRIVQVLAREGELGCGELAERVNLSPPTLSHHTAILTDAGLLDGRWEGKAHVIALNREALDRYAPALLSSSKA